MDASADDRRPAPEARPAGAADHPVLLPATTVAGRDLVGLRRRGAVAQRPRRQLHERAERHVRDGPVRMDAAEEAQLVHPQVAEPGQVVLVADGFEHGSPRVGAEAADRLRRVPVGPQRIGPEPADEQALVAGLDQLDDGYRDPPRRRPLRRREPDPHLGHDPAGQRPAGSRDRPRAVEAQVGVQRQAAGEPLEQVLAVRDVLEHRAAGEVHAGMPGDAQLTGREGPPVECPAQPRREAEDRVALRHPGGGATTGPCRPRAGAGGRRAPRSRRPAGCRTPRRV